MRTKASDSESKQSVTKASAQVRPAGHTEHQLLRLQRSIGNRAVNRLIQAKLRVSQPGDPYEQEADRIAEQVVSTPGPVNVPAATDSLPTLHRKCDACASGGGTCSECAAEDALAQRKELQGDGPVIQRQPNSCQIPPPGEEEELSSQPAAEEPIQSEMEEEGLLQRVDEHTHSEAPHIQRSHDGQLFASSDVTESIESTKGLGQSLPANIQREFGHKMGADFSQVRIHTDGHAARLATDLSAHAFTHGTDIYFNNGKYNPDTSDGKFLLAHELAHTMQQSDGVVRRITVKGVGPFVKSTCGGRRRTWKFELDTAAPSEGYMVQQVDAYDGEWSCPNTGMCLANPTLTYWEAWRFNKGDTLFAQYSSVGFSDMSGRPPVNNKVGEAISVGTIKFFSKATTGDLGDLNTPPASGSPNASSWGPGKAPRSFSLPSTKSEPSWWSGTPVEGPARRSSGSDWRCCPTGTNFNVLTSDP